MRKPIICWIHLLNFWWFSVNFRWRSSPILFRFCRLSLPWYTLFSCIVGVFNNICCRSLKSAKRFSIANNCKKTNQIKRIRNKNRYEKKSEKQNSTAIGNGVTLFVTRWWQALTISYLTDSFEIIIMPKEMFFLARLWQINSKVVFLIFALKRKEILGFSGVTKR